MTSMDDPSFRSQQFAADQRWRGQAAESEALGNIGSTAIDTVRYLQNLQQRQSELDLRTQQWQVERQIQMQKLGEMQMIDQADDGRLRVDAMRQQVRQMQLQNDHAEFALEQSKSTSQQISPAAEFLMQHGREVVAALNEGLFIQDPSAPQGLRLPKSKEESEQAQKEAQDKQIELAKARTRALADTGWHDRIAVAKYFAKRKTDLEDEIQQLMRKSRTKEQDAKLKADQDELQSVNSHLDSINQTQMQQGGVQGNSADVQMMRAMGLSDQDIQDLGR